MVTSGKAKQHPSLGSTWRRIRALLEHGINLVAYHLPLDVHAKLGNNVQLAQLLGWHITGGLEPNNPVR